MVGGNAPTSVTVTGYVDGHPQVGADLTAEAICASGSACDPAKLTYQWQIETAEGSGVFSDITTAGTNSTYKPLNTDQKLKLQVIVNELP